MSALGKFPNFMLEWGRPGGPPVPPSGGVLMVWRRMLAAAAAIACVGGMAIGGVIPPVAHASPAGRPAAAAPSGLLPPHVFAPYYFNTTDPLAATAKVY